VWVRRTGRATKVYRKLLAPAQCNRLCAGDVKAVLVLTAALMEWQIKGTTRIKSEFGSHDLLLESRWGTSPECSRNLGKWEFLDEGLENAKTRTLPV
jgi:hypothetical protein